MLVIATLPVHETSLSKHFHSTLFGRREGVCKNYSLYACEIMDDLGVVYADCTIRVFFSKYIKCTIIVDYHFGAQVHHLCWLQCCHPHPHSSRGGADCGKMTS